MTVGNMKKLEAAHHMWQRRILEVVWKDKVSNEMVKQQTGMAKLEEIITKRRLRWLGYETRGDNNKEKTEMAGTCTQNGDTRRDNNKEKTETAGTCTQNG